MALADCLVSKFTTCSSNYPYDCHKERSLPESMEDFIKSVKPLKPSKTHRHFFLGKTFMCFIGFSKRTLSRWFELFKSTIKGLEILR